MNAIICIGDSITFGRGEVPAIGWCGRLKQWFESKDEYNAVYNLGIPGDTSTGVLKRIIVELDARIRLIRAGDTFHVILAIGTNDLNISNGKQKTNLTTFEKQIQEIITIIESKTPHYSVLQIPPVHSIKALSWENDTFVNTDVVKYNEVLKRVSKTHYVTLEYTNWDEKLPDGIHPNSTGYEKMFLQVKKLF